MQFTHFSAVFPNQKLVHLATVGSTNAYAKQMVTNFKPYTDGTVILADEQTQGKGQYGASWLSQAGANLTFSVVCKTDFLDPFDQFLLSQVVSLALIDFFSSLGIDTKIKWPNDIFTCERKIAGVLIENVLQGDRLTDTVIGIGINVNQLTFPPELSNATSLIRVTGKRYGIIDCLNSWLQLFEKRWKMLKMGETNALKSEYNFHLLGRNMLRHYTVGSSDVSARVKGVTESGELIVDIEGRERRFWHKEITFNAV